ncbi:MAG: hypothetical protein M1331_00755 [Candidatus Marsarchaeota archaeon]|nr:hypothetical protein [Candidatus Marsarchaeota archaeon]MCL5105914.1 hypothetical protein [Candidatus Marsarchaeota archaeon]
MGSKEKLKSSINEVNWQAVLYEWLNHEYTTRKDIRNALNDKNAAGLIKNPDLKSKQENSARLKMLSTFRTYLSEKYFTKRQWSIQTFDESALDKLLLPIDTGWKYISGGSYRPMDSAKIILKKPESLDSKFSGSIRYIEENYKMLSEMKHKLIVVGNSPRKLEIIEGAHRLTAIFYRKLKEPNFVIKPMQIYRGINKKKLLR